jgi:hypothetical protein
MIKTANYVQLQRNIGQTLCGYLTVIELDLQSSWTCSSNSKTVLIVFTYYVLIYLLICFGEVPDCQ